MENKEMNLAEEANWFDKEVDEQTNVLLKSLGYEIFESMSFPQVQLLKRQMEQNGHILDIESEQEGNNYVVEIKLTKRLMFNLED